MEKVRVTNSDPALCAMRNHKEPISLFTDSTVALLNLSERFKRIPRRPRLDELDNRKPIANNTMKKMWYNR